MLFPVLLYSPPHPNWLDRKCCHRLLQDVPKRRKKTKKEITISALLLHTTAGWITARDTLRQQPRIGVCSGVVIKDTQVRSSAAVLLLEMEADGPHPTTRHTGWGMAGIQALFLHPHTLPCSQTQLYCVREEGSFLPGQL